MKKKIEESLLSLLVVCLLLTALPAGLGAAGGDGRVHNPAMPYRIDYSAASDALVDGETLVVEATTPPDASAFAPVASGGYVYSNGEADPATDPDCPNTAIVRLTLTGLVPDAIYSPAVTYYPAGDPARQAEVTLTPVDPAPSSTSRQWTFRMPAGPVTMRWKKVIVIPEEGSTVEIKDENKEVRQIGGEEPVTVDSISIATSPTDTLTLSNVTLMNTDEGTTSSIGIEEGVQVILKLKGENQFGIVNEGTLTLSVGETAKGVIEKIINNGSLVLTVDDPAVSVKSEIRNIINNGSFKDEAGIIEGVEGEAPLAIKEHPKDGSTTKGEEITLSAKVMVRGSGKIEVIWQKLVGKDWVDLPDGAALESASLASQGPEAVLRSDGDGEERTFYKTVYEEGTYRCQVTNAVSTAGDGRFDSATTLSTHAAMATFIGAEPEPEPEPEPTPDVPTDIVGVNAPEVRVGYSDGLLRVYTPVPAYVAVYSYGGSLISSRSVPAGDTTMQTPAGPYIVRVGDKVFKIIH